MIIDRNQGRAARGAVGLQGAARWAVIAAAWLVALGSAACSDDTGQGGNSPSQDVFFGNLPDVSGSDALSSADSGKIDAQTDSSADTTDVKANTCPGGGGCSCASNAGCDTGLCLDTPDGKQCAQKCSGSGCPLGLTCAEVTAGTDILQVCVPAAGRYCNPCLTSADCTALAIPGAACVDYGDAGKFCGIPCKAKQDCPASAECSDATTAEGTPTKQCTAAATSGKTGFGVCPCSKAAQAASLATTCSKPALDSQGAEKAKCSGSRICGPSGLTECALKATAKDSCNGIDDDCDGTVDNPTTATCDGGQSCVAGKCTAQCSPVDGGWTAWGESACSKECGGGTKTLTRSCSNPAPSCGGQNCQGESSKTEACNTQSCQTCTPVNGGWSAWTAGACSKTCGGGSMVSTRTCTSPAPSCGGADCSGEPSKTEVCNPEPCSGGALPLGTSVYADGGTVIKGTVPSGITKMIVQLWGGGGGGGAPGLGGGAGWVHASVPVKAGDQVELRVASGGFAPGGGGGASYVIVNGSPLVVAAGGGGAGSDGNSGSEKPSSIASGGSGGGAGGAGSAGAADDKYSTNSGGGGGGSQTAGGAGGISNNIGPYKASCTAQGLPGAEHTGGEATQSVNSCGSVNKYDPASWHLGGKAAGNGAGGGGGAGWFGGGSGGSTWTYTGGGGGGGSSWANATVTVVASAGGSGQAAGGLASSGYGGEAGRGGDRLQSNPGGPNTPAQPGNSGRIVLTL
jgi:hypothetical protein